MANALNRKWYVTTKLLVALLFLLAGSSNLFAFKVTIDSTKATGNGNYRTLNEALTAINNKNPALSTSGEDTVLFADTTLVIHEMSAYISSTSAGQIRFLGQTTNPDKFPLINHSSSDWYNFFANVGVTFERLHFTGPKTVSFSIGNTSKSQTFKNCIIRDTSSTAATSFFKINGSGTSQTSFENCLISSNKFSLGLIDIQTNPPPVIKLTNCTIHGNAAILACPSGVAVTSITIKNCVFSGNTSIFTGPETLKARVTNSFVPSDAYSSTTNKVGSDPRYLVSSGKSKPSDWRLLDSSDARNLGDTAAAPKTDISGAFRSVSGGKIDAGCWDILDGVKLTAQPKSDTITAGDSIWFTANATGTAPISYTWYKAGSDIPLVKTDTLLLANVPLTQDSTFYYCIAANPVNSVTSQNALLRVIAKPVITDQPDTSDKFYGDTASFSVAATGNLLRFSWQKNDTTIPGATSMLLKVPSIARADSGDVYRCIITNDAGSVTSQKALLRTYPAAVKITSKTADLTLMEGEPLSLSVSALGRSPLVFEWKLNANPAVISQTSTYAKPAVSFSDSGTYRCYVSNNTSKDSVTVKVRVTAASAARITVQPDPKIAVKVGSAVNLSVSTSGAQPFTYTWYKGTFGKSDSIGSEATYAISAAALSDSGSYFCIVANVIGKDTTSIISLAVSSGTFFNPLKLSCSFVDLKHVKVTISNFRELPVATTATYSDTIGIWYEPIIFPSGNLTTKDTNCIPLPLAPILAKTGDSYDTIVTIKQPDDECRTMCFIASPVWHLPDTIIAATASAQTAKVYMCDSAIMKNNLDFSLTYTPLTDSVAVKITKLTSINRDSLLYLLLDYTLGSKKTVQTKILPSQLPAKTDSILSKTIKDSRFNESEDTLTVNLYWRGILGNSSNVITKKIVVGKPRPINTATLLADSTTSAAAFLSWQFQGAREFDSIRIFWSMQKITPSTDLSAQGIFSKTIVSTLSATSVTMLFAERVYYAALQVIKDNEASLIPQSAICTFTTKTGVNTVVENSIKIVSSSFIPATNEFMFTWVIDTLQSYPISNLATGIMWEERADPAEVLKITQKKISVIANLKDTNTAKIDIGSDIRFKSTFHFAFILSNKASESWALSKDSSRCTVSTSSPEWQKVHYFTGNDTMVTAFNDAVQINKIGMGTISIADTLLIVKNVVIGEGFIAVSPYCIDFKKDGKSDPIRLTLKYDAITAPKAPERNIRMYQYSSDSTWSILDNCIIDTTGNSVSVALRPNEFPRPFMLLCDTLPPMVSVKSDTISTVDPGMPLTDSIEITDNSTNCLVTPVYWGVQGKGGSRQPPKRCTGKKSTIFCSTPADSFISDRSLKSEITVSDGVHEKVIDLSRVINRSVSDPIQLAGMKWTPVTTTAKLTDTTIEMALNELSPGDAWKYDPLQFRIFQWGDTGAAPSPLSTINSAGWMEYQPSKTSVFAMNPGKVIWVKSRKTRDLKSLGAGTTIPVKNPFKIILRAKQWNDIALPYLFNVCLGDIFATSDISPETSDSLLVYTWKQSELTNNYVPTYKFVPNLPGQDSLSSTLTSKNESTGIATYTVLNNSSHDITLQIPPLPESFSSFKNGAGILSKKQASAPLGWSLAIAAETEYGAIPPVLCGNNPESNSTSFPAAPAHSQQRLFIGHGDELPCKGVIVDNSKEVSGSAWSLAFANADASPVSFKFAIATLNDLPKSWKYALFHPESGKLDILRPSGTITADAHTEVQKTLLVGDSAFIASYAAAKQFRVALHTLYPNPCRGNLTLQLTLPGQNIQHVALSLYDQLGRRVSHSTFTGKKLHEGLNTITTRLGNSGTISAGTYLLELKVIDTSGKTIGSKKQRLLYLP